MRMPDITTSENSTRIHKVKQFLVRVPRLAAILKLQTLDEDNPITLGSYEEKDLWTPELASEVVAALEAHVTEEPSGFVRCKLLFENGDGRELKAMRLVYRQEGIGQSQYGASPGELTGTSVSMVIQAQKHTEMCMRLMAESQIKVLQQAQQISQHACDVASMLAQRLAETEQRVSDAQGREKEMRDLAEKLARAEPQEREEGMAEFMKLLQPVLPYVAQALMKTPPPMPT